MRILALDIGEKNIGLAISDALGWTAQGLPSLLRKSEAEDIAAICALIKERQVSEIVSGMPFNLDGSLGKSAKGVSRFLEELKQKTALPVKVWDERFTSAQAERVMLEADLSRKKRRQKVDRLAAQLILQSYLDNRMNEKCEDKDIRCTKEQP